MKEKPILFSAPMVSAILEGRKTMTRRGVKGAGDSSLTKMAELWISGNVVRTLEWCGKDAGPFHDCPYGALGDRLWVRETHYAFGRWVRNGVTKKGHEKWRFVRAGGSPILYSVTHQKFRTSRDKIRPEREQYYKRPARFMPRWASRITLEITGVRVERLQDITEEDAIAEGVDFETRCDAWHDYVDTGNTLPSAVQSFASLWTKINGCESWDSNPWVWVVEFKRVAQP